MNSPTHDLPNIEGIDPDVAKVAYKKAKQNFAILDNHVRCGSTLRYHCNDTMNHRPQSVAQHCWNMNSLLYRLYPVEPPASLVRAIHHHDSAEFWVGDVPYPAKVKSPELAALLDKLEASVLTDNRIQVPFLTDEEKAWLKFLDRFESYLYMTSVPGAEPWPLNELVVLMQQLGKLTPAIPAEWHDAILVPLSIDVSDRFESNAELAALAAEALTPT